MFPAFSACRPWPLKQRHALFFASPTISVADIQALGNSANRLDPLHTNTDDTTMTRQRMPATTSKASRPRSKPINSSKRRRIKKCFPFMEMPIDLGYEKVFSYLSPKDLLALTRTNRDICTKLLDKAATGIWRTARQQHYNDAPGPFQGVSEARWATLLFDSSTLCEANGSQNIALEKRICHFCVAAGGIKCNDVALSYANVDPSVLSLASRSQGAKDSSSPLTEYYSKEELDELLNVLQNLVSKEERDEYIEGRKTRLEGLPVINSQIRSWIADEERRRLAANWALKAERREAIKERLIAMGYTREDYWKVSRLPCVRRAAPLTDRSWALIQKQVIDTINQAKLQKQQDVLLSREDMISRAYISFKRSLPGIAWRTFPSVYTIGLLNPVHHLKVSPDGGVTEEGFKTVMEADLIHSIQLWRNKQKRSLVERLSMHRIPNGWRNFIRGVYNETQIPDFDPFFDADLAVIAIKCRHCGHFCCGFDAAIRHLHGDTCAARKPTELKTAKFNFEPDLSRAAALCIIGEGLNPWSATTDEMDQRGSIFQCVACAFHGTWRAWVEHAHSASSMCPNYVGKEDMQVRKLQGSHIVSVGKEWACSRCNDHVEHFVSREIVVNHLIARHGILNAIIPNDFLYASD
ncbi:hypothetical protein WG66_014789 [Moniliophthora roreri]|uniref:F-box domain-containing protein n=1 Tax=Moniliophthora roreri TaxID=221103 RepID=A0A0W0FNH9_MONRR|nr:hypothetical protein WG66_014789 [Moniliophthora roreri]